LRISSTSVEMRRPIAAAAAFPASFTALRVPRAPLKRWLARAASAAVAPTASKSATKGLSISFTSASLALMSLARPPEARRRSVAAARTGLAAGLRTGFLADDFAFGLAAARLRAEPVDDVAFFAITSSCSIFSLH
jgi:hypothetical protein